MKDAYMNLGKLLNDYVAEKVFPGATYSVCNSTEKYEGVTGYKAVIPKPEINTIDTLYDIASLTKVIITNTILARALQENLISLNDKVGKYLPHYSYLDITIYDIVTHQSGLPSGFDTKNIYSNNDFQKQLDNLQLTYKTGTEVIYSDPGFILLGLILEKVYDKKLDQIADEEVLRPLGMKNSTFHPSDVEKCAPTELTEERGLVRGRTHDEKAYYSDNIVGHAGLFCDVDDVTKFAQMVLNNGIVNNKVYLEKKYIDMWFTPQVVDSIKRKRSIGWLVGENNLTGPNVGDNVISHTGFTGTSIVIDRDKNIGIILLSNRVHPTRTNRKLIKKREEISQCVYKSLEESNNVIC